MLFAHLVIAASLAVLAAVNVIDNLTARVSLADESSTASCREAPGVQVVGCQSSGTFKVWPSR